MEEISILEIIMFDALFRFQAICFFFGRYHWGIIQLSLVVMRIGSLESNRKFLLMILFGLHSSHLKIEHSFISACLVIFQELYLYTPTVYIIYIIHVYIFIYTYTS